MIRGYWKVAVILILGGVMGCASFVPGPRVTEATGAINGRVPASTRNSDRLSIMTLNLWGQDNYDRIQSIAAHLLSSPALLPDFFAVCEVVNYGPNRFWSTAGVLGRLLGYHVAEYDEVAILSRFPLSEVRHLKLKNVNGALKQHYFQRYAVAAVADVPRFGKVRVISVHYAHDDSDDPKPAERNTALRLRQIRETTSWVGELNEASPADIHLLAGDFNAEPHWDEMLQFRQDARNGSIPYQDHNGVDKTWRPLSRSQALLDATLRLDYVFWHARSPDVRFVEERLLWKYGTPSTVRVKSDKDWSTVYVSDHLSVLHVLSVK